MTDTELLRRKINASGYRINFIALKCGITYQAFLNRLQQKAEFRANEMRVLSEMLNLTPEDNQAIFFANKVDETSTNSEVI